MRIAVDFDGTIVEHRYPEIGPERSMATHVLRQLQADGHQLILWTVRKDQLLNDAIAWCRERGVEFYAVNANHEGETDNEESFSRKITYDIVIDDRNIGGLPHWSVIYQLIHRRCSLEHLIRRDVEEQMRQAAEQQKKRHWWNRG